MDMRIDCPHCCSGEEDEWEALDCDQVAAMNCLVCRRPYYFAIMECAHCGAEGVFSWATKPSPPSLDWLTCERCTRTYRHHESVQPRPRLLF